MPHGLIVNIQTQKHGQTFLSTKGVLELGNCNFSSPGHAAFFLSRDILGGCLIASLTDHVTVYSVK